MQKFNNFLSDFCAKNSVNKISTLEKLQNYVNLLIEENKKMNLIGKSTIENIWTRHILDCGQLADYIADSVVDLGSGSGLPGIILAIMRPDLKVMLVEKSPKKCIFLEKIIKELFLSNRVIVINKEVYNAKKDITQFVPEFITCRAFKPLDQIIELVRYYQIKTNLILLKGENLNQELLKVQNINYQIVNGIKDLKGFIIKLTI